jgi:hypothetical protein
MVLKTPVSGRVPPILVEALLRRLADKKFANGVRLGVFQLKMKELLKANGIYDPTRKEWEEIVAAMKAHEFGAVVEDGVIRLAGDPPPFDHGSRKGTDRPVAA